MTITQNPPNVVHLGGRAEQVGDLAAKEAITPGMLVEMDTTSTVTRWKKSTLTGLQSNSFAKNASMLNKDVDDAYAAGDLMEVGVASPGCVIWGLIPSGASIVKGAKLSDNGDGTFKAASGVTNARALETVDNTAGPSTARIRVEFL